LSSRQRTVFLLRFVEELKISEIAQTVGLSVGAVKCHLARAVHNVRVALKEG
jgi:RNA polymerase sigma-70 factor (ECF subfamily)